MNTPDDQAVERPIATVDLAIFALSDTGLSVLLVQRANTPFARHWALPGGWVHTDKDKTLEAAAKRILLAKTGVETPYLEQLQTVGGPSRDPRGWSVSVAYIALLGTGAVAPRSGEDTLDARWAAVRGEGVEIALAFDHAEILADAVARLRAKVEYSTLPAHLLPDQFTLSELQSVYERILDRKLDKSAFRKRVAEAAFVEPVPGAMRRASNRPAQIYRLKQPQSTVLFDRTL